MFVTHKMPLFISQKNREKAKNEEEFTMQEKPDKRTIARRWREKNWNYEKQFNLVHSFAAKRIAIGIVKRRTVLVDLEKNRKFMREFKTSSFKHMAPSEMIPNSS